MNGLFIGRFQPFHLGHYHCINWALTYVESLWIGLGSSNKQDKDNPFTTTERKEMIVNSVDDAIIPRLRIFQIPDHPENEEWVKMVTKTIPRFDIVFSNNELIKNVFEPIEKIVLQIPHFKRDEISGTTIRKMILEGDKKYKNVIPGGTEKILRSINARKRLQSYNLI